MEIVLTALGSLLVGVLATWGVANYRLRNDREQRKADADLRSDANRESLIAELSDCVSEMVRLRETASKMDISIVNREAFVDGFVDAKLADWDRLVVQLHDIAARSARVSGSASSTIFSMVDETSSFRLFNQEKGIRSKLQDAVRELAAVKAAPARRGKGTRK